MPAAGVPLSAPVVGLRFTLFGSAPVSLKVDGGYPLAATGNEPKTLVVKVTAFVLVIEGASSTVNVKGCVAFGWTPLAAVIVIG